MKKIIALLMLLTIGLMGCSNASEVETHKGHSSTESGHSSHPQKLIPIDVELTVPEIVKLNEPVTITARVTQKNEAIGDAKVVFEWWLEGEEHKRYEASVTSDGKYEFKHSFDKAGTYTVISHVDARDLHSMPKKEFKVK